MLNFLSIAQSPTIRPSPLPNNTPLVDSGTQDIVYIGFALLAIAVVIVVGILNRKIEYALIFAAILSAILIGILWFF